MSEEARAPGPGDRPARGAAELGRLALIVALWLLCAAYLLPVASRAAPLVLQRAVSFQAFRVAAQILTLGLGLGACFAALGAPRDVLALRAPGRLALAASVLLSPAVTVVATLVALRVALPWLMQELALRGAGASRQNAGAFGREITEAPLLVTLLSGALLAALSEELLFRGALWSLVDRLLSPLAPRGDGDSAALWETPGAWWIRRARRGSTVFLLSGGGATIAAGLLFGWMHRDLPGAVGIVRVVSTTCLGLASGFVRWRSRSIVACVALHAAYNVLALGVGRGWFTGSPGTFEGVPLRLMALAAAGAGLLLLLRQVSRPGQAAKMYPARDPANGDKNSD